MRRWFDKFFALFFLCVRGDQSRRELELRSQSVADYSRQDLTKDVDGDS